MTTPLFEEFLARLYTDEQFLKCFLAEPEKFCLQKGLQRYEVEALLKIDKAGLILTHESIRFKKKKHSHNESL